MSNLPTNIHLRNVRLAPHVMYICPECGRGFRTQNDWRMHLNVKHDYANKTIQDYDFKRVTERFHECQTCLKWVASEKNTMVMIQYHRFTHLPYPLIYRCLHCREMFQRRRLLNDHLEQDHAREIKQYEIRVNAKKVKEEQQLQQQQKQQQHKTLVTLPTRNPQQGQTQRKPQQKQQQPPPKQQSQRPRQVKTEKDDLIRKALYNSHIDLDFEANSHSTQNNEKNPSEVALDRSLSALEEMVRQDMADNVETLPSDETTNNDSGNVKVEIRDECLEDIFSYLLHDDFEERMMVKKPQEEPELKSVKLELEHINHNHSDINTDDKLISIQIDALDNEEVEKLNQAAPGLLKSSSKINKMRPSATSTSSEQSKPKSKSKRIKLTNEEYENLLKKEMYKHVIYLCPECAKEFNTENSWRKHIFNEHDFANITESKFTKGEGGVSYECLECFEVIHTAKHSELLRHYFQHSPYRSYLKCNICNRTKSNTAKIINHIKYNHNVQLQVAFERVAADVEVDDENASEDTMSSLRCEYCSKVFKYPERLHKHVADCKRKYSDKDGSNNLEVGYKEMLAHLDDAHTRMAAIRVNM